MPAFEGIAALLKENEGPYVLGREVSFADFVIAGLFRFLSRLDHGGDVYGRAMGVDERLGEHVEATKQWLVRED